MYVHTRKKTNDLYFGCFIRDLVAQNLQNEGLWAPAYVYIYIHSVCISKHMEL